MPLVPWTIPRQPVIYWYDLFFGTLHPFNFSHDPDVLSMGLTDLYKS